MRFFGAVGGKYIVADTVHVGTVRVVYDFYGYSKGEQQFNAVAYLDDKPAGILKGSSYQGIIRVKWVEVTPDSQKRGVGKALYMSLLKEFNEGEKIDNGYTTPEGTRLWESVRKAIPQDRIYIPEEKDDEIKCICMRPGCPECDRT